MKVYEITYLTESEETIDAKTISPILAENKAKIVSVHPWGGRRKLVYPIKKQDQAFYTTVVFEAETAAIAPMTRALQLNAGVLRSLVVDYTPGYFERSAQQSDEAEASKGKETDKPKEQATEPALVSREETPVTAVAEITPVEEVVAAAETVAEPEVNQTEEKTETESETTAEDKKPATTRRTKKTQKTENLDEKLDALLKEDITQ